MRTLGKVSVIIPSRNEQFLAKTAADVLVKAGGDVEVIVVLDGAWASPEVQTDPRVKVLHFGSPVGMRPAVNAGALLASGEFLLKLDAHCLLAEGFDTVLKADCPEQGIVVPRRYALDAEKWAIEERTDRKYPVDYEYLAAPDGSDDTFRNVIWNERRDEREAVPVDDLMVWQGSAWCMRRTWWDRLGGLDAATFGPSAYREAHELGLKTWFSGGRCVVTKRTWYAHLHKRSEVGRGYDVPDGERARVCRLFAQWATERHAGKLLDLVDRFNPPGWPKNSAEWDVATGRPQSLPRVAVLSANLGAFDRPTTWVPQVVPGMDVSVHRFDDATLPPRSKALTPALQSSLPKWFGPEFVPGADLYLWLDASFELELSSAVAWFVERLWDAEMLVFRHPARSSVREELDYLAERLRRPGESYVTDRYAGEPLEPLRAHLAADRDWADDRLFSLGAFLYRPTPRVLALMREVWHGQTRWHRLDQLHFPRALAQSGVDVKVLPEDIYHQGNGVVFTRSRSWRRRHA